MYSRLHFVESHLEMQNKSYFHQKNQSLWCGHGNLKFNSLLLDRAATGSWGGQTHHRPLQVHPRDVLWGHCCSVCLLMTLLLDPATTTLRSVWTARVVLITDKDIEAYRKAVWWGCHNLNIDKTKWERASKIIGHKWRCGGQGHQW